MFRCGGAGQAACIWQQRSPGGSGARWCWCRRISTTPMKRWMNVSLWASLRIAFPTQEVLPGECDQPELLSQRLSIVRALRSDQAPEVLVARFPP